MKYVKRLAFALALSGAFASMPALAQQRDLPHQPPGEPMQGMMQDPGMMEMMHGMMMGGTGDAAGRERPQLSLALQNRAELGLTEPQVTKLDALVQRFRGTAEQRVPEIEAAETELAALLKQDASAGPQVEAKCARSRSSGATCGSSASARLPRAARRSAASSAPSSTSSRRLRVP